MFCPATPLIITVPHFENAAQRTAPTHKLALTIRHNACQTSCDVIRLVNWKRAFCHLQQKVRVIFVVISAEIVLLIVLVSRHPRWRRECDNTALKLHLKLQKLLALGDIAGMAIQIRIHTHDGKATRNIMAKMAAVQPRTD